MPSAYKMRVFNDFVGKAFKAQGISSSPLGIVPKPAGGHPIAHIAVKPNPAQGNPAPARLFLDHALVKYNGKIYDPSYGTGPFNSLKDWENASLESCIYADVEGGPTKRTIANHPDTEETKEGVPILPPPPTP